MTTRRRNGEQLAKQNIYDDPDFFAGYVRLRESRRGLHEAVIEPSLGQLLPDFGGRRVVDLGCGDGWFCRRALAEGAASVVGIEPSARMLERAVEQCRDPKIWFLKDFAETACLWPRSADVVISILALHYVEDLDRVIASVASWLDTGGIFVAIIEHPIVTSQKPKTGFHTEDGVPLFWPVDHYFDEGERREEWFVDGVVKYHHRVETIVNAIVDAGLRIEDLSEPAPIAAADASQLEGRGDLIRPAVLGIRARKDAGATA